VSAAAIILRVLAVTMFLTAARFWIAAEFATAMDRVAKLKFAAMPVLLVSPARLNSARGVTPPQAATQSQTRRLPVLPVLLELVHYQIRKFLQNLLRIRLTAILVRSLAVSAVL